MKFQLIWVFAFVFGIFGSTQASSSLEALYQPQVPLQKNRSEIEFWKSKIKSNPNGYIYFGRLASAESRAFQLNGNIQHLKNAENHLLESLDHPAKDHVPLLCALARNYISQHRFCEALDILDEAATHRSEERMVKLLLFDVYLELGWNNEAKQTLNQLGMDRNFDYLIRRAKWEDGQGRLNLAVRYLERARKLAEKSNQKHQKAWIYSNLGDFYGHQGRIDKSKSSFIKALQIDPGDDHSLKGLAWIEYSHNDDPEKALQLLDRILSVKVSPDHLMLKAELLSYISRTQQANELKEVVFELAGSGPYGDMYNLLKAEFHLEKPHHAHKAIQLLEKEVQERSTPEIVAFLSYAKWKKGDLGEARKLAIDVIGQTFEPVALLHILAVIEDQNSRDQIIKELKDARYELGPVTYSHFESLSHGQNNI
ncbi:MAG: tetratricopeptide repeat protein [Saprospiraceae bacterium]|nr:tetratricopeptide repeat protein [Saprospiraceae bacterium]